MRVLVTGGRDFADKAAVWRELDKLAKQDFDAHGGETDEFGNWMPLPSFVVIHGGCNCEPDSKVKNGADFWANEWCICNWIEPVIYWAEWKRLGRAAGPIRNSRMADESNPDIVLAFPGGGGTWDMTMKARIKGFKVLEIK